MFIELFIVFGGKFIIKIKCTPTMLHLGLHLTTDVTRGGLGDFRYTVIILLHFNNIVKMFSFDLHLAYMVITQNKSVSPSAMLFYSLR